MNERADWLLKLEQRKAEEQLEKLARGRAEIYHHLEETRGRIATQQELLRAYKVARKTIREDQP